jgi:hypothetical protein
MDRRFNADGPPVIAIDLRLIVIKLLGRGVLELKIDPPPTPSTSLSFPPVWLTKEVNAAASWLPLDTASCCLAAADTTAPRQHAKAGRRHAPCMRVRRAWLRARQAGALRVFERWAADTMRRRKGGWMAER